jgi:hypothetical protein
VSGKARSLAADNAKPVTGKPIYCSGRAVFDENSSRTVSRTGSRFRSVAVRQLPMRVNLSACDRDHTGLCRENQSRGDVTIDECWQSLSRVRDRKPSVSIVHGTDLFLASFPSTSSLDGNTLNQMREAAIAAVVAISQTKILEDLQ